MCISRRHSGSHCLRELVLLATPNNQIISNNPNIPNEPNDPIKPNIPNKSNIPIKPVSDETPSGCG